MQLWSYDQNFNLQAMAGFAHLALSVLLLASAMALRKSGLNETNPSLGYGYPKVPAEMAAMYTWTATATHYSPAQGGHAICGSESGYCGAPSDGSQFWSGDICTCSGSDRSCSAGYCQDCNGANLCQKECPHCPTGMCGRRFKITCLDPYGRGYCRYGGANVVMTVTNACPQYNPCNTCKNPNPCRGGYNHIDLCDVTFNQIAYPSRQPGEGIMIGVDPA